MVKELLANYTISVNDDRHIPHSIIITPIAKDLLPVSLVESAAFRELMSKAQHTLGNMLLTTFVVTLIL